ncbi:zinc-binding dehydrogenase [Lysinibacillus sp. NPDC098008]|uniref:zinc-binding dehydrogenase n=1 Tax=Lysinibacillus sp. NPDC098008 TaxID=3364146 RepID=UPI00381BA0AC
MLAGVFESIGTFKLKEVEEPQIQHATDIKIMVEAASICGTDVHILSNPPSHPATPNTVLGHEFVGRIIEKGEDVQGLEVGDRVIIDPTITCEVCVYCQSGHTNVCENFTTIGIFENGGWAKYCVAPARNAHKISEEIPVELAAMAEPLSCVVNASEKLQTKPGDAVVILGAGPMGQLFVQMQKAAGAGKIIVVDFSEYRLEIAKKSGATHVVNPNVEKVEDVVAELTRIGADSVVDCVGMLFDQAIQLVRKAGNVLLLGMNDKALPAIHQCTITGKELTIYGSIIQNYHFPKVVQLLESNVLNLEALITEAVELKDVEKGLQLMREGKAIKIIIKP